MRSSLIHVSQPFIFRDAGRSGLSAPKACACASVRRLNAHYSGCSRSSAVNLAKRILEFSTDVNQFALQRRRSYEAAQQGAKDPPISYYQLTGFLQNNESEFTEEGMAYRLQAVGTSTSAVERGANLETERFTRALREYLREPPQIVVRSLATN